MHLFSEKNESKNELLTVVLHNIQSPLRFIGTISHDLLESYLVMDNETLEEHIKILNTSIVSLKNYCTKIYTWKSVDNLIDVNKSQSINEIFDEIKLMYGHLIASKKIDFIVVETDINYIINKEILFTILINLIDNAYKNTDHGSITLQAHFDNGKVLIMVIDTGRGIPQKKINSLIQNNIELTHTSLGYYIINDLLKKINGSLKIISTEDIGTKVIISL